jgi:hypothetical protein
MFFFKSLFLKLYANGDNKTLINPFFKMAWPWKKFKHQEKTSTSGNQQQMSDVTNDE